MQCNSLIWKNRRQGNAYRLLNLKTAFNSHFPGVVPRPVPHRPAVHMHEAVILDNPRYA